jgi:shikimate dehydrogenase
VPSATLIEKCCLVAQTVAGNPTQYMVEPALAQQGLDWRFMSFEVEPERLGDAVRGLRALGFRGVKVGDPFQERVIEHLDDLTEAARQSDSVNCITADGARLVGDNTEGAALVELLQQQANRSGRHAMVIGAGRVACALASALAAADITDITIADRDETAAQQLVDRIQQHSAVTASATRLNGAPLSIDPETAVLIDATLLATDNLKAKLPINVDSLHPDLIVVDVTYNTSPTRLTQQAAERGCRVIDGLSLYVQQTALALRAWTGKMPDTAAMRDAAEEFLGI